MTDDVKNFHIMAARELAENIVGVIRMANNVRTEGLEPSLHHLKIALEKASSRFFELKDKE